MQASTGCAGAEMIGAAAADQSQVEAASPISSRPPVDEFAGAADEDEQDRGVSGGNRWPRQETLALLRIRSEMDATFRDATLKGPLWEDVSRKLGELGYRRSAKKCKEKFENVHKYYKRTKEGRAGRQDGKTYKFFTELEALNATTTTVSPPPAAVAVAQNVAVSSPSPITSISYPQVPFPIFRPAETAAAPPPASAASFSTDSASTSPMSEDYEGGGSRKRKRNTPKMVEVLEGMMKKVMAEQEAMQRRFLEAVDKREQERTAREEAWRRQESARLAREHDLLAHERAVSASRDAAIISFLQKLTGQTIPIPSPPTAPPPPPPPPQQQQHHQPQQQQQQLPAAPALTAVPEQQVQEVSGSMSSPASGAGPSSSRWPKAEVLALIKLRSGLEGRYQEAGPKGPLWEEVSLGMGRMGYKRSSKRCKEKWENINKYFKKVKESNKKRPEDAKTCPYFHQLDALYRNKSITQQQQEPMQKITHDQPQNNNGGRSEAQASGVAAANLFGEEATKKPEDIVKDVMMEQQLMVDDYDDKMNESDEDMGEDEDGEEEDEERNGNMEYKIEFQRPNNNSNGGGNNNEAPSFFAMVQ